MTTIKLLYILTLAITSLSQLPTPQGGGNGFQQVTVVTNPLGGGIG